MTVHEKTYRAYFDLIPEEIILSEISSQPSSELHHIHEKGMGGRKTFEHNGITYPIECIENYIALTRDEHIAAHANKYSKEQLWDIHQQTMNAT